MDETALLRELSRWWTDLNHLHFEGAMKAPSLGLDDASTRLGCWVRDTRSLQLSRHLIVEHSWGVVVEVLRHEMAHQYVDEVLRIRDQSAHGAAFQQVCRTRSIDGRARGLPVPQREHAVLRKVHALLALADSENQHEAQAAMNAAHRLMRRHNVETTAAGGGQYGFVQLGSVRKRFAAHERIVAGMLGVHFFVQPIWVQSFDAKSGQHGRVLEIIGRPENLDIASHVHGFLLEAADRLWNAHRVAHQITSNRERRRFLSGVMSGFFDKLSEEAEAAQKQGLVWIGDAVLDGFVQGRHPNVRSGRRGRMRVDGTWSAGHSAGGQLTLHRPVGSPVRNRGHLLRG